MSEYFPKPKSLGSNVKLELDLFDYATKTVFEKLQQGFIHQIFLKRLTYLIENLMVDKLDIDKLI